MIVLDTNVVSEATRKEADQGVTEWFERNDPDALWLTSTTVSELLLCVARMPAGPRRNTLRDHYSRIFAAFEGRTLSFESRSAVIFGDLVAERLASGRQISREDAQIASGCIATGAALATRNIKDFKGIPGLELINPWDEKDD